MQSIRGTTRSFAIVSLLVLVGACSEKEYEVVRHDPEAIHSEDSCHVCGMSVARFPGPKGQAFVRNQTHSFKFCSTQDLFSWLLQPETPAIVQDVYVHDMGETSWEAPGDDAFIDATRAWYVVGHDQHGAMGPTLASFGQQAAAQDFAARHGGRVLRFADIDLDVLIESATP